MDKRMNQKLARLMLLVALLVGTGACSRSADSPEAIAALQQAIVAHDVASTETLLKRGIDPRAQTEGGQIPLKSALEALTGTIRDPAFSSKKWEVADPKIQVMRHVMRFVRRSSHAHFDGVGRVDVKLRMTQMDLDKGATFLSSVIMVMDSGEKHELVLSIWETDYLRVDRQNGWNPVLRPGGTYRVVGVKKDDVIEVESIELMRPPDSTNAIVVPAFNFLPSTFEQMKAFTWLGEAGR